jgi:hypothetical protein
MLGRWEEQRKSRYPLWGEESERDSLEEGDEVGVLSGGVGRA